MYNKVLDGKQSEGADAIRNVFPKEFGLYISAF